METRHRSFHAPSTTYAPLLDHVVHPNRNDHGKRGRDSQDGNSLLCTIFGYPDFVLRYYLDLVTSLVGIIPSANVNRALAHPLCRHRSLVQQRP